MRLVVTGDREWSDEITVAKVLTGMMQLGVTTLIHGDCRGLDKMAGEWGELLGMKVEKFPAEWTKYGRAAGPLRNQQMINEGHPTIAVAFHNDLKRSRGTKDMVTRLKKAKIKTFLAQTGKPLEEL